MSADGRSNDNGSGYGLPPLRFEIFAAIVALLLVYGLIALVGNGGPAGRPQAVAAPADALTRAVVTPVAAGREAPQFANFLVHKVPQPLPEFGFVDETGGRRAIGAYRGKFVLLNLWATWCGPCRHEMPALDALSKKLADRPFALLAISIDRGGLKKPRRFFNEIGVKNLALYGDEDGRLAPNLKAFAMPTTLLIDPEGREIGRMAGPAEWSSPEAVAFLEAAIASRAPGRH